MRFSRVPDSTAHGNPFATRVAGALRLARRSNTKRFERSIRCGLGYSCVRRLRRSSRFRPASADSRPAFTYNSALETGMAPRNQIFISYAHEDASWRDEFTDMLQPAIARGSISLWSDQNIPVG